jgi:Zn-dependent alcohol dehydrogenase
MKMEKCNDECEKCSHEQKEKCIKMNKAKSKLGSHLNDVAKEFNISKLEMLELLEFVKCIVLSEFESDIKKYIAKAKNDESIN